MPRVRMNTQVVDRYSSWDTDREYDMPADVAQSWISAGIADLVTDQAVEIPERRQQAIERRVGRPRKNR